MNDSDPAQATPLELPPAALNAHTGAQAHHDSEEAVQYERRRISRELEPIVRRTSARPSTNSPRQSQATPSAASLHSHYASTSIEHLRRHASAVSGASTQPDNSGASEVGRHSSRSSVKIPHWYDPIVVFWTRHICPTIDEGTFRDHLALERTFLGYLRTSLILVMTGVIIAQLFRLQRTANPDPDFGFYVIGLPLSVTFIGVAIAVLLIGAVRIWRIQRALIAGKTYAGGWEVLTIMGMSALVSGANVEYDERRMFALIFGTFALVLGVDIDKTYYNG
ncbi:Nn.00g058410.m01.CDS01 [Neocucurbitaria sp. VM-36]